MLLIEFMIRIIFHVHNLETKNKAIIRNTWEHIYFNNWKESIEIVFMKIWANVSQVEYYGWFLCMITTVSPVRE
jgi:hypothetical protein